MSKKQRNYKHEQLRKIILKQLIECGYSKPQLAKMLHISLASLYNKMKNPDKFTYKELNILFERLKFSKEELLQII